MKNLKKLVLLFAVAPVILSACRPGVTAEPTPTQQDPNIVLTAAAETAQARMTEIAGQATATSPPATPTDVPAPSPSPTMPVAEEGGTPTATQAPAGAPAPASGDNGVYVKDVTIPDGTILSSGASFTKTWQLMNTGSTTWNTRYSLVHISDNLMGAKNSVPLTVEVPPNQVVDISVEMVAPTAPGSYRGFWRLRNPDGQFFGDSIYVDIVVGTAGTPLSPTATATTAPTGGTTVSQVSLSVDNPVVSTACPHSFRVEASFTLGAPSEVTYRWEAGSDTPGFTYNLPGAQSTNLPEGNQSLAFFLQINDSGSGWIQLHILSPQEVISNQATFSLTCQ